MIETFRTITALTAATLLLAPANAQEEEREQGREQEEEGQEEQESDSLGIGDPAPPIRVASWVKGGPVALEKGRTYVVEFWATWCAPCRASIPHLTELAKEYEEQVDIVGVSVWENDWSRVAPFVEEWGERMDYNVAVDLVAPEHDGFMAENWMRAAGRGGIPSAFVVNDQGRIAWIGHPLEMDEPLARIVAGEWDLEAMAEEEREKRVREAELRKLTGKFESAMNDERHGDAIAALERMAEADPENAALYGLLRFRVLVTVGELKKAYAVAGELVTGAAEEDPNVLNEIAWTIVSPENELGERDLDLALRAGLRANVLTDGRNPSILDTVARIHFVRGDARKALEVQEKAVSLAEDQELAGQLRERLAEYRRAVEEESGSSVR